MTALDGALLDLRRIDRLAEGDSPVHRLDPRAKLAAALLFLVAVVSTPRAELASLAPFALYPVAVAIAAGLPLRFVAAKSFYALPFVLAVGAFEPLLDPAPAVLLGPIAVSRGWLALASLAGKSLLAVSAALILIASTGMPGIVRAMRSLGCPAAFATQILLLHRYLLVLGEEAARLERARDLRDPDGRSRGVSTWARLAGSLLLRSFDRAERIHRAMAARGFSGDLPDGRPLAFRGRDLGHLAGWGLAFAAFRLFDPAHALGRLVAGWFR